MKRLLVAVISFIIMLNTNIFANENQFLMIENNNEIPTIYSGKYYSDVNTAKVTIENFNISDKFIFQFPEGIKVISYDIIELEGLEEINKGKVQVTSKNANTDLNYVFIENIKITNNKNTKITIQFQIIASPQYKGDIPLSINGMEKDIIIAKAESPITIKAEKVEKDIDYIRSPKTNIIIEEAYAGAIEEQSNIILKVKDMNFSDDCILEVLEGDIKADCKVENGLIIITVNQKSQITPAKIKLSNVTVSVNEMKEAGEYGLFSIALDTVKLDKENNVLLKKGNEAMFETYFDKKIDFAPVFYENEVEIANDFVRIVSNYDNSENQVKINDVFFQIGSETIYVNGEKRTLENPAYISNTGNTMLPLRDMVSAMFGENIAKVYWNSDKKVATILYNEIVLNISLGTKQMEKNGVLLDMGKEMELIDNRIFVPLRDICVAFDVEDRIDWNGTEKTVIIHGTN